MTATRTPSARSCSPHAAPRRRHRALGLAGGLLVLWACARGDGASNGSAADACPHSAPIPGPVQQVWSLAPGVDRAPVRVGAACARPGCLKLNDEVVTVVQPDGRTWAAWEGRPGALLEPLAPGAALPTDTRERWARTQTDAVGGNEAGPRHGRPVLPPELRTCGTTRAGGGLGWHIIRNDGDVWQRVHWSVPPVDPAVLKLPPEAYPLALGPRLCAHAVQVRPRDWVVHPVWGGEPVVARPDREHPPASCWGPDALEVETPEGTLRVDARGLRELQAKVPTAGDAPRARGPVRVMLESSQVVQVEPGPLTLAVQQPEGTLWMVALASDAQDLAGAEAPKGAGRRRLLLAGDGRRHVWVAERLQRASCDHEERVHVLDTVARTVTTVTRGAAMNLRAGFSGGRFYWVAGLPADAVGAEDPTTLKF